MSDSPSSGTLSPTQSDLALAREVLQSSREWHQERESGALISDAEARMEREKNYERLFDILISPTG